MFNFYKKNTWYGTVVKYAVIADWTGAVTRILASWSRTQVKMELFDNTTLTPIKIAIGRRKKNK